MGAIASPQPGSSNFVLSIDASETKRVFVSALLLLITNYDYGVASRRVAKIRSTLNHTIDDSSHLEPWSRVKIPMNQFVVQVSE